MSRKGTGRIVNAILVTCCLLATATIARWALRHRCESSSIVLVYRQEGEPLVVAGRVVDADGDPMPGIPVDLETDSGGNLVTTDANGMFSENMGELELIAVTVGSQEPLQLRRPIGISTQRGLWLDIICKNDRP